MKKLILFVAQIIMVTALSAQDVVEYGPDVFIDIDGIQIGDYPTREELNSHFGTPVSEAYIEADMYNYYEITYDGIVIDLDEKGKLFSFDLNSSKYPVMTLYGLGEGIRIGDSLDKFLKAGYPIYWHYELDGVNDSEKRYCFYVKRKDYVPDHVTTFTIKNGIITAISSWPYES